MKNNSPAFQFYPADYLADEKVQLMNLQQEGVYIRALSYCWREGSIPSDPQILATLIGKGCTEEDARVVQECFVLDKKDHSRMKHLRLDSERKKQKKWKEKSSEGGKRSGEVRRKRDLENKKQEESLEKTNSSETKGGSTKGEPTSGPPVEPKANSSSLFSSSSSISSSELNSQELINSENKNIPFLENTPCRVAKKSQPRRDFSKEIGGIFAYWQEICGHPKAILDKKREKAIRARLEEGYSLERILAAIRGIRGSPHHMGKNENHTVYDDIELICRDGKQVDKFADLEEKTHGTFESDPWKSNKIRKILKFGTGDSSLRRGFFEGDGNPKHALREPGPR
ncbi:MAG: hypothetical protein BWY41_00128 [Candidatus Atribacteria bacterium ADurb.Bin276]|uniref:DUF1376 domain-containing protein n=1 Tax=Candidatus Atribacter allofermentans TaxID=1852833 RepID=A0A1V5T3Z7_9BACT|nr:MAG: hypothetical protein BWY41_00128 [Candidatus Atribacteria bacterium ADurb.Bin276]